jgi:hypothetical protein
MNENIKQNNQYRGKEEGRDAYVQAMNGMQ